MVGGTGSRHGRCVEVQVEHLKKPSHWTRAPGVRKTFWDLAGLGEIKGMERTTPIVEGQLDTGRKKSNPTAHQLHTYPSHPEETAEMPYTATLLCENEGRTGRRSYE